jgi:hypothetical protein
MEDWALSLARPDHWPSLGLASDGCLRLASGLQARLANHYLELLGLRQGIEEGPWNGDVMLLAVVRPGPITYNGMGK